MSNSIDHKQGKKVAHLCLMDYMDKMGLDRTSSQAEITGAMELLILTAGRSIECVHSNEKAIDVMDRVASNIEKHPSNEPVQPFFD